MAKAARKSKSATVHFSIDGEYFTQLVRTRVLEDNPGSAWRIATSLHGQDGSEGKEANAALAILKGDKKLVGIDELELVDEDINVRARYLEQLAWLYAGRIRISDRWYRPVAEVTSFGPRDLRNDRGKVVTSPNPARSQTGLINRQWHYTMGDEIAPLAHEQHDDSDVIFEPCSERPHWMDVPRDVRAAIAEWRKLNRQLEERGHHLWYKDNGDPLERQWYANEREIEDLEDVADDIDDDALDELIDDKRTESTALSLASTLTQRKYVESETREERRLREIAEVEANEAEYRREERERLAHVAKLREQILAQAGDDMIELTWATADDKLDEEERERAEAWGYTFTPTTAGSAKVPRAPFLHWAFDRLKQYEAARPAWNVVSPMGMKIYGYDNPYHTDWAIGAGFDPRDRRLYRGPIAEAASHLAWLQQERHSAQSGVHVLVDGPYACGPVVFGKRDTSVEPGSIVVLPNLHPKYLQATVDAAAVITEEGGETAHLAQVGRERRLPIVRMPNALELFHEGEQVVVNTETRTVEAL